ncbi:MAG TPA: MarR family winged helix-turn-helix transcriptional regulator [Alphaproteobacteria bacterium]|jgi:DNA-binding MarR family transcriptional regulator
MPLGTAQNAERKGARGYAPPVSVSRPACLENGRDDRLRALLHALFVTAARFEDVRGAFGRRIGATGPQYTILAAIAERQGSAGGEAGVGIRALADHLHVAPSHITTEVNKLVSLGLVEKRANPADGRGVLVRLARPGEAALDRLGPFRREINDLLFDGVSRIDFQTLARLFERFLVNTERALDRIGLEERERKRNGHG